MSLPWQPAGEPGETGQHCIYHIWAADKSDQCSHYKNSTVQWRSDRRWCLPRVFSLKPNFPSEDYRLFHSGSSVQLLHSVLRPPRSSPRAAAAARSSPWPGGAGRTRAARARKGAEPSWLLDEAPTVLGRNRGSLFPRPPGASGSVSGRRWLRAAGRGRAGQWSDPRAPALVGPGTRGAVGAPGP